MGKHSKKARWSKYRYQGRHRVVTPKSGLSRKTLVALTMTLSMALYPAVAGDGEGNFPLLEDAIPILRQESAAAGEVITEPTEEPEPDIDLEVDLPVDELPSP